MSDYTNDMKVVMELPREQWSDFVWGHPKGNIFQCPEIHEVWKRTEKSHPFLISVINKNNEILGILQGEIQKEYLGILGRFTARSIVWGGPIVINDNQEILDFMQKKYILYIGKKVIYSQFRNFWKQEEIDRNCFKKNGFQFESHLNIIVDLKKTEEELWKEVHSKRRNEIRRAKREGTSVRELKSKNEIEEAFQILSDVYKNARVPMHDFSLFRAAYEILHPKGMVHFFGAFNNGNLIGTIFVLCYKDRVYDWYAGSLREYYQLYPNDILPWEVFLWARDNGYKFFDFGGAGRPDNPYGVRDYKKKFGGEMVIFGRYEKIHKPLMMKFGKLGLKIWKRIR